MNRSYKILLIFSLLVCLLLFKSCNSYNQQIIIVPANGYSWPNSDRPYWPTDSWETSSMENHDIDTTKMSLANQFAKNDTLARALLVIKDGYIVYENYYGDGGIEESTNLWSVTKSFASATVGLLMDDNNISSTYQLMTDLLPQYPEFNDITLHHVLTQTTGLSWDESGQLWNDWILSDDWVFAALERRRINVPGKKFYYSSGNSHFLSALVYYRTNITPGKLAQRRLFDPMGIEFEPLSEHINYNSWHQYTLPLHQTWRQDPKGIECASFGLYLTARDMAKFGFLYLNKGRWDNLQLISENWVETSTRDHVTNIYGRYSYGYQWYLTLVGDRPAFLASGFGGQMIGVVPSLDLVVVLKYEADNPVHPSSGSAHDDMHLFELVVESVN